MEKIIDTKLTGKQMPKEMGFPIKQIEDREKL